MLGLQHSGCHSRENGNPETKNRYPWIPRIKCGAGSAGVYPDENRGRNDKRESHQPEFQKFENVLKIPKGIALFSQECL